MRHTRKNTCLVDFLCDRTSGTLVSASIHDRHVELIRSECMPSVSHLDHVHLLHQYSSARYDDLCPISLGLMQWSHILSDDPYLHRIQSSPIPIRCFRSAHGLPSLPAQSWTTSNSGKHSLVDRNCSISSTPITDDSPSFFMHVTSLPTPRHISIVVESAVWPDHERLMWKRNVSHAHVVYPM